MKPFWKESLSPRQRKLAYWIAGLLLFYTVAGFLILPPIIRAVAIKQLSQQLNRKVSIEKVKLNPYALSVTIRGLLIADTDGQPFVSWDEVYVNFQLSSFFGHPWVFKEISTTKPYLRVQMNKDYTFNFSDLIQKFATNSPAASAKPVEPSKPLALEIEKLQIAGASASLTDLTPREPFKRVLGPLDVTLEHFRTDPSNKNPYSFSGTTDAGETFSWSGFFYLSPLRSEGTLALDKITLNKYAPLYQDLVCFEIRDGSIGLHSDYRFELSASNRVAAVTNTSFALHDFKLAAPGDATNMVELHEFAVNNAAVDLESRQASVAAISVDGGKLFLRRDKDNAVNVLEAAKPAADATNAPGGILFLLRSVTNAVAMLLNSTNQWAGSISAVNVTNCGLHLEDLANSRPATLDLNDVTLDAKNISNIPNTNLNASLSLRWNTNGTINTEVSASIFPADADIHLALTNLDLGTLDPYLEPKLNLFIIGSRLGMNGDIHLRTPTNELPQVTFHGDVRLDDFHTVDGVMAEDLLKWNSVRINGIDANLNPQIVSIREIDVDNAYAKVVIETNGMINLMTALRLTNTVATATNETKMVAAKTEPALETQTATAPATNNLPRISVGSIVISNAALNFTDHSLSPNVHFAIQQAGGTIAGISTEQLQHADLNLHALVDGVGPADITGVINPFSGTQTNKINVLVKNVDLTPVSPYSGKFAGYRIARGKLNLNLQYEVIGRKLTSKNVIMLDQFTFGEKVNSPEATHLPVRLAIAILKDREGKIVLDVPIEGSLDDPQFRIHKVVTRALLNILTKVATSPFSLLAAAFGGGGEELSYQEFAPGGSELTAADKQKLDSLAKALYGRPALQLEIAGSIEPVSDHDGLQRANLEKELRTRKWMSLRKSERMTITPAQVVLTPEERTDLIIKLYGEAVGNGTITPTVIAANTNLAVIAAQIKSSVPANEKGAQKLLRNANQSSTAPKNAPIVPASVLPAITDPKEALLVATMPVTENDLQSLAAKRAKAVRTYLNEIGKVEAERLFLTGAETGGIRSDGARAYLQFQ